LNTVTNPPDGDHQGDRQADDPRAAVLKAALLACGGFTTGITSLLVVAGMWHINDGVTRYAITVVAIVATLTQLAVAAYVLHRR
jgi:hypothetical protein